MNVSLTAELEKLIQQKVASGLYLSASEVVRDALRLLEERDKIQAAKLEELRKEIRRGLDQADRGESVDGPRVFKRLRKQVHSKGKNGRIAR